MPRPFERYEVMPGLCIGWRPDLDQLLEDEPARTEKADPSAVGKVELDRAAFFELKSRMREEVA